VFFNGANGHEETDGSVLRGGLRLCIDRCGAGPIELQGLRRPAEGMHEELRRPHLQDRVSDVHEVVREEIVRPARAADDFAMTIGLPAGNGTLPKRDGYEDDT
jgi:hypothetical protein